MVGANDSRKIRNLGFRQAKKHSKLCAALVCSPKRFSKIILINKDLIKICNTFIKLLNERSKNHHNDESTGQMSELRSAYLSNNDGFEKVLFWSKVEGHSLPAPWILQP